MPRGGKRAGAGGKPVYGVAMTTVTIRMTPGQAQRFKELGGARWLRSLIGPVDEPPTSDQMQLPEIEGPAPGKGKGKH